MVEFGLDSKVTEIKDGSCLRGSQVPGETDT